MLRPIRPCVRSLRHMADVSSNRLSRTPWVVSTFGCYQLGCMGLMLLRLWAESLKPPVCGVNVGDTGTGIVLQKLLTCVPLPPRHPSPVSCGAVRSCWHCGDPGRSTVPSEAQINTGKASTRGLGENEGCGCLCRGTEGHGSSNCTWTRGWFSPWITAKTWVCVCVHVYVHRLNCCLEGPEMLLLVSSSLQKKPQGVEEAERKPVGFCFVSCSGHTEKEASLQQTRPQSHFPGDFGEAHCQCVESCQAWSQGLSRPRTPGPAVGLIPHAMVVWLSGVACLTSS